MPVWSRFSLAIMASVGSNASPLEILAAHATAVPTAESICTIDSNMGHDWVREDSGGNVVFCAPFELPDPVRPSQAPEALAKHFWEHARKQVPEGATVDSQPWRDVSRGLLLALFWGKGAFLKGNGTLNQIAGQILEKQIVLGDIQWLNISILNDMYKHSRKLSSSMSPLSKCIA